MPKIPILQNVLTRKERGKTERDTLTAAVRRIKETNELPYCSYYSGRTLGHLIHLCLSIRDDEVLPEDGISTIQAQSSMGFCLVCMSSEDLLAEPLQHNIELLVNA